MLAADYVKYRDAVFVSWVRQIGTGEIGGQSRWHQLRFTAGPRPTTWRAGAYTDWLDGK